MNSLVIDHGCNSHAPDAFWHQAQQGALIGVNIGCGKMPVKSEPETTIASTFPPRSLKTPPV
ncbi:hypothetical protein D8666_14110 [Ochrobactrum soli]|uniref:Uncharacterized protein n=1 Tax=Ochrobactrum soli TaxID=2448455 RepID=A0A2P9HFB1_9HYPH|nr:hypothetical protein D8666_14110 [[Ochrobactrum] soli]SPL62788.1 hypothetical protein OHAE_2720 [[Ochrobactrum] soli]